MGIPPPIRGHFWRLCVKNNLAINSELYGILCHNVSKISASHLQLEEAKAIQEILLDATRTFPSLAIFSTGGPLHGPLVNVLSAYVCYRPDISYVQGMAFVAGMLLLHLDECDAFIVFANLVNFSHLFDFFSLRADAIERYVMTFHKVLRAVRPDIHALLVSELVDIRPAVFEWLLTLFSRSLSLDAATALWDVLLVDVTPPSVSLFRCCVAIFVALFTRLGDAPGDVYGTALSNLGEVLTVESVHSALNEVEFGPEVCDIVQSLKK